MDIKEYRYDNLRVQRHGKYMVLSQRAAIVLAKRHWKELQEFSGKQSEFDGYRMGLVRKATDYPQSMVCIFCENSHIADLANFEGCWCPLSPNRITTCFDFGYDKIDAGSLYPETFHKNVKDFSKVIQRIPNNYKIKKR